MPGMIDVGNSMKRNSLAGMQRLENLEGVRERTKEGLDAKDEADHKSNQMSGAGLGAAIGGTAATAAASSVAAGTTGTLAGGAASVLGGGQAGATMGAWAGPIGIVAGASIGYLIGSLF